MPETVTLSEEQESALQGPGRVEKTKPKAFKPTKGEDKRDEKVGRYAYRLIVDDYDRRMELANRLAGQVILDIRADKAEGDKDFGKLGGSTHPLLKLLGGPKGVKHLAWKAIISRGWGWRPGLPVIFNGPTEV